MVDLDTLIDGLSPRQRKQLLAFDRLLGGLPADRGYIGRATVADRWNLHLGDSLAALPLLAPVDGQDPPGDVIDVGSGAGLPGIPLAIALPGIRFTLLDLRAGRIRFLEQIRDELELANVFPLKGDVARLPRGAGPDSGFDVALARALARPPKALELCRAALQPAGQVLLYLSAGQRQGLGREVGSKPRRELAYSLAGIEQTRVIAAF